jgi:hypothetical protein
VTVGGEEFIKLTKSVEHVHFVENHVLGARFVNYWSMLNRQDSHGPR